jgi:hypothetical protein
VIAKLQAETPLSQLSHDDARKVFDRAVGLGYCLCIEHS